MTHARGKARDSVSSQSWRAATTLIELRLTPAELDRSCRSEFAYDREPKEATQRRSGRSQEGNSHSPTSASAW